MPTTQTSSKKPSTRTRKPRAKKTTAQPPTIPCYRVAAVRGIQATREYYSLMMPIRLLTKSFLSTTDEMPAAMRSQRLPNSRRIKQIAAYVTGNPASYVFSSVTASITFPVAADEPAFLFESVGESDARCLQIPLSA